VHYTIAGSIYKDNVLVVPSADSDTVGKNPFAVRAPLIPLVAIAVRVLVFALHSGAYFFGIKVDDSEIEKATITVTFTAYPYLIANKESSYTIAIVGGEERTATIINESVHKVIPTLQATAPVVITKDNSSFAIPSGELYDEAFEFKPGGNSFTIKNSGTASCVLTITFRAEVM
jgi:hypothetical protein